MSAVAQAARQSAALLVPAGLVAAIAVACGLFADPASQSIVRSALIELVLVVGLYIYSGNSGIMSFGHAGFMAIGAYTAALLTIPVMQKHFLWPDFPKPGAFILAVQVHPVPAALIAGVLAALIAIAAGFPLMKMAGFQASIATLALLIIFNVVIANWKSVTHGTSTIIGVPPVVTLWSALAVAEAAIACAWLYQISGRGLRLRAVREDVHAAAAIGIGVVRERIVAFGLSAFVVAIAGALYAFTNPFSADTFYLTLTFNSIAILVIGGQASLWGAVLGTTVVSLFTDMMRRAETGIDLGSFTLAAPVGTTEVGLGIAMLAVLIVRPRGLSGGYEASWPWVALARRRAQRAAFGADDDTTAGASARTLDAGTMRG
jgi:branched-chain amino acid transport system permease protein